MHLLEANTGPREWIERTIEEHRALLHAVRRQFESLRDQRTRLRQQVDGDELDLQASVDAFADARAGMASDGGLYQCTRAAKRELAVALLIDVSGSTDGWVSQHRRVIDVEREALLLVCLALQSLGEPYSVLAFSGESRERVTVRSVESFAETFGSDVAARIAGLEPEAYTRVGAAIRHTTSLLMREPARHRLLLLLSDGKPNGADEYAGRYGVEDMRQFIVEARLQGILRFASRSIDTPRAISPQSSASINTPCCIDRNCSSPRCWAGFAASCWADRSPPLGASSPMLMHRSHR